jgi:hypothetical protein
MLTSPKKLACFAAFLCLAAGANWFLLYEKFQSIGVCRAQVEKVKALKAKVAVLKADSNVGKTLPGSIGR